MTIKEHVIRSIPEMERLAAEGMSARGIASTLGVNYNTLQMYRRELGLPHLGQGRILGPNHRNWRGGRSIESRSGYVRVFCDEEGRPRYIYEHVLVAEKKIGRRIVPGEVVHHLNCDRTDNRPENLRVVSRAEHVRLHKQLEEIGRVMLRRGHVRITDSGYELDF
jgi:hypothetical protein